MQRLTTHTGWDASPRPRPQLSTHLRPDTVCETGSATASAARSRGLAAKQRSMRRAVDLNVLRPVTRLRPRHRENHERGKLRRFGDVTKRGGYLLLGTVPVSRNRRGEPTNGAPGVLN